MKNTYLDKGNFLINITTEVNKKLEGRVQYEYTYMVTSNVTHGVCSDG